ncbi:MAG: homospermidine biosynthesis protein, partial [Actinomycetota bacterium]
ADTVGVSLSGAPPPTGLGVAALVPLIEAGFIDWIVSTGANLYHDLHRSLGFELHGGSPFVDDVALRDEGVIRIYDITFDADVLYKTDDFVAQVIRSDEFQRRMGAAEFHYLLGKYLRERERVTNMPHKSVLSAAYEAGIPVYTSSPGDSSLGMNVAALSLRGNGLGFDPEQDVNETAAIVYDAKSKGGKSAVLILGGGSPKNFVLQTEPQLQEIMGISEAGHDYFIQITDARPDTGGLSGATPAEAVTWGKIDPDQLPDTVVCYTDSTIALPIMAGYALANAQPRPHRRLYDQRAELITALTAAYVEARP